MIDIHTHILPGVDDGAKSREESIATLDAYQAAGFTHIVCTPHLNDPYVKTKVLNIRDAFVWLQGEAEQRDIKLMLGSELYMGANPGKYIPFLGSYLLVETDVASEPLFLLDRIFDYQVKGLKVIFAHVERYEWFSMSSKTVNRMKEMGVYFQVNAGSLKNKFVLNLIQKGWVDFIASDNHGVRRGPIDFETWKHFTDVNRRALEILDLTG